MEKVVSRDGTVIAFDRSGSGSPVILMGGALNDRQTTTPLAALLAPRHTVLNYDRRGRGSSGDTAPYSVEREIEDLAAVVEAAGGSAALFANCTGGMLALRAVAAGVNITRLALYEPPYIVDDSHKPLDDEYRAILNGFLAEGRNSEAVEHFMLVAVGIPPEIAARRQTLPIWPSIEALAPTLSYDAEVAGDNSLPTEILGDVAVPTLVMFGGDSPPYQGNSVAELTRLLPDARSHVLEGHNHKLVADAVAPPMLDFFA
jgi:pimeloyl-ACP methyl ester carboxylesterase